MLRKKKLLREKRNISKTEKLLLCITLPLALFFCAAIWLIQGSLPVTDVYSDSGIWDLREIDFSSTNVRFTGKVEYIPGALLTPEEFDERQSEAIITDTYGSTARYGTSRIRIRMPEDQSYAVSESSPLASDRIYLNGIWMEDIGHPGSDKDHTIEGDVFFYYTVQPKDGVIEIVQQVSNYAHRKTESQSGYVVGTVPMMRAFFSLSYTIAALLIGCFLALALVHITLWFLFREYKVNLYFSLFCMTWVLRTAVTGPKLVTSIFPDFSWFAAFSIEYITVAVASVIYIHLFRVMFPGTVQRWFLIFLTTASALFISCHFFLDSLTISRLLLYYQVVMGVTIVYVLVRAFMKIRRVDLPQSLFLAGGGWMMYATVRDILFYRDIFIPPYGSYANAPMSEMGLLMFVFLQMIAVFIGTLRQMDAVRSKEQKLLAENAALDRVNTLRASLMETLSHELRTPLAVMMGYAEIAVKELRMKGVDEETTADLDTIAAEAGRLAVLVEETRRISMHRDAAAHRQFYLPADVICQTVRMYKPILERQNTTLSLDIMPELPGVYGSPEEFIQVMFNLLTNAAKHTEGGRISISAESDDTIITVSVSDNGSGISPEFLPRVFERYAHDDADGTGLGLAICKEIVEGRGGSIRIESKLGEGTAVIFTLLVCKENER